MSSQGRINEELLRELAVVINREVGLPDALITVTFVDCDPDLKRARVGVSVLPDKLAGTALRKLQSSTSEIVGILRGRLRLRRLPRLVWEFDATEREADKIERLIADLDEDSEDK